MKFQESVTIYTNKGTVEVSIIEEYTKNGNVIYQGEYSSLNVILIEETYHEAYIKLEKLINLFLNDKL